MNSKIISNLKYGLLTALLFFVQTISFSQLLTDLNITFTPDPNVLEWHLNPNMVTLTVTNTSMQTIDFKITGEIKRNGIRVADNIASKMLILSVGPNETVQHFAEDVIPSDAVSFYGNVDQVYLRTNQLPGGFYEICVRLVAPNGQLLSQEICRPFQITAYQQPSLISPYDGQILQGGGLPVFSWSPTVPLPDFPVTYRLRVFEMPESASKYRLPHRKMGGTLKTSNRQVDDKDALAEYALVKKNKFHFWNDANINIGTMYKRIIKDHNSGRSNEDNGVARNLNLNDLQKIDRKTVIGSHNKGKTNIDHEIARNLNGELTPVQIIRNSFPVIDIELSEQNQTIWPLDLIEPENGHEYIWIVQALKDDGTPVGDNDGFSEIGHFKINDISGKTVKEASVQEIEIPAETAINSNNPNDELPDYIISINGELNFIHLSSSNIFRKKIRPKVSGFYPEKLFIKNDGDIIGDFGKEEMVVGKLPKLILNENLENGLLVDGDRGISVVLFSEEKSEKVVSLNNTGVTFVDNDKFKYADIWRGGNDDNLPKHPCHSDSHKAKLYLCVISNITQIGVRNCCECENMGGLKCIEKDFKLTIDEPKKYKTDGLNVPPYNTLILSHQDKALIRELEYKIALGDIIKVTPSTYHIYGQFFGSRILRKDIDKDGEEEIEYVSGTIKLIGADATRIFMQTDKAISHFTPVGDDGVFKIYNNGLDDRTFMAEPVYVRADNGKVFCYENLPPMGTYHD